MARCGRVFISVAEDSADAHAAALIRAARQRLPDVRFYGLTGPRMRAEGAETLVDLTSQAAMLTEAIGLVGRAWQAIRLVERSWRQQPPDLVVLLDSPELHLRLAARAKRLGLAVLYYIAPQTWAAREGRNRHIARCVDHLACILPFEQAYFRRFGIPATYVGHPLFETLRSQRPKDATVARLRGDGRPLIALLPGSRRHVIETMFPLQLCVIAALRTRGVDPRAVVSAVDERRATQIRSIAPTSDAILQIVAADNASLLTAADLVLVASGTATLEVAYRRKPMIVMYDAGRLLSPLYRAFGRYVVRAPHLSLVNVLAGRRVVPEFMPFVRDVRPIAALAARLLCDESWRRLMMKQLDEVVQPLEHSQASNGVCALLEQLLPRAASGRRPVGVRTAPIRTPGGSDGP